MALPPGITPKTVTVGIASFFDGSLADGTATITAPVNVVHGPSNRPVFSSLIQQRFVDGATTFTLCPTDAAGLNRVDWTYKLNVVISGALVQPEPVYFILPEAGPDTIDLDALVTVPSSAGTPVSTTALTSMAGLTGDVTAQQAVDALGVPLSAALVPKWTPSTTVTAGSVWMAPDGKTITRNANGTTRASYDATEQALWTVAAAADIRVVLTAGNPATARPVADVVYWVAPGGATNAQAQDLVYDTSAADTSANAVVRFAITPNDLTVPFGGASIAFATQSQYWRLDPTTTETLAWVVDPARMSGWTTYNVTALILNDGAGAGGVALRLGVGGHIGNGEVIGGETLYTATATAAAQNVRQDIPLAAGLTIPAATDLVSYTLARLTAHASDTLPNDAGVLAVVFEKAS